MDQLLTIHQAIVYTFHRVWCFMSLHEVNKWLVIKLPTRDLNRFSKGNMQLLWNSSLKHSLFGNWFWSDSICISIHLEGRKAHCVTRSWIWRIYQAGAGYALVILFSVLRRFIANVNITSSQMKKGGNFLKKLCLICVTKFGFNNRVNNVNWPP